MVKRMNDRKIDAMFEALTPIERARLLARFWRDHHDADLDRLRAAIPDEGAGRAYNEAIAVLRGINSGFIAMSLLYLQTGFERDYLGFSVVNIPGYREDSARDTLWMLMDLIRYPVTQSEHNAIIKRARATLRHVEDWADAIWGEEGLRPELDTLWAEYGEPYTHSGMSDEEREAWLAQYYARVAEEVQFAIDRGELPKSHKAPKDAIEDQVGIWLPDGVLSDWAKGTTEATYPIRAVDATPVIGVFASSMECEVFPDSEMEHVRARRAKLRDTLIRLGHSKLGIPQDKIERLSFEPAKNAREWNRTSDDVAALEDTATAHLERQAIRGLMEAFAERNASLRALTDAIAMFQCETFGGEDPLDPQGRKILERAWDAMRPAEGSLSTYALLPPLAGDADPWPPALEDEVGYAEMLERYEGYIRRGGE